MKFNIAGDQWLDPSTFRVPEQIEGYTISRINKNCQIIIYNGIIRIQFNTNNKTI